MRVPYLSAVILLVVLAGSATLAWAATATFTPASGQGQIFTVIDFPRAQGRAQPLRISVQTGGTVRNVTVAAPYSANSCSTSTPAGVVFRIRRASGPVTIVTTGAIVRPPYQGDLPVELLHPCYRLVS